VRHFTIAVNKSKTINFASPISTVTVASPDIADVVPMTSQTLWIVGKQIGVTDISTFDAGRRPIEIVDVEVVAEK
jgi:pilus assembly protein CpaC